MPMYYFHLCDDESVMDFDGTDLDDVGAARAHAIGVARELTFNSRGFLKQDWSQWTMTVHDDVGTELFSIAMSDFGDGGSGK
jgi:hypothetical protein